MVNGVTRSGGAIAAHGDIRLPRKLGTPDDEIGSEGLQGLETLIVDGTVDEQDAIDALIQDVAAAPVIIFDMDAGDEGVVAVEVEFIGDGTDDFEIEGIGNLAAAGVLIGEEGGDGLRTLEAEVAGADIEAVVEGGGDLTDVLAGGFGNARVVVEGTGDGGGGYPCRTGNISNGDAVGHGFIPSSGWCAIGVRHRRW